MLPDVEPTTSAPVERREGYIVRVTSSDGKRIYRPEFICNLSNWPHPTGWPDGCSSHLRLERRQQSKNNNSKYYWTGSQNCSNAARHITMFRDPQGYWTPNLNHRRDAQPDGTLPTKKPVQRLRMAPRRVHVSDDPIDDGRDLAQSEVELPSDRLPAAGDNSEQELIAELYRRGILYDSTDVAADVTSRAEFGLNDIQHDEPTYTVRLAKRRVRKTSPSRKTQAPPERVPEPTSDELIFVPQELWEQMSTFSDMEGFELVVEDDLLSVAESWVELDAERI